MSGRGGQDPHAGGPPPRKPTDAELDKLTSRLERIQPKAEALRLAIDRFGTDFSLAEWTRAFESSDPDDINAVGAALNDYCGIVSNIAALVQTGVRATRLEPAEGSWHPASFRAHLETVCQDGGVSKGQRDTIVTLDRMRNGLQHDSPSIGADEAHREIEVLLKSVRGFLKSYLTWLEGRGISI